MAFSPKPSLLLDDHPPHPCACVVSFPIVTFPLVAFDPLAEFAFPLNVNVLVGIDVVPIDTTELYVPLAGFGLGSVPLFISYAIVYDIAFHFAYKVISVV